MRVVVALGGNALLRRGEPMTAENQRAQRPHRRRGAGAGRSASTSWSISHGNGPQVGLLALQGAAYKPDEAYPLDVLGAETEGMIGYMIEQELGNLLPFEVPFATLLTMVEVDPRRSRLQEPDQVHRPGLRRRPRPTGSPRRRAGSFKQDGDKWRRVVASPRAEAHLRDAADQVAARARHHRDRRRRRRHPDDVRAGRRPQAGRRRVRDRQGPLPPSCWRASSTPTCS